MVKKNRINLIDEFRKIQKGNDFIILTTFTFDPIFFDNFLFREMINNNPLSEIMVLVDSVQYEKSFNYFTQITGNKYHLIPIFINKGVFHPKIFIFISKDKICYYLGSCNLTFPGFTKNAELISKTEYGMNQCLSDIQKVLEIIEGLNHEFIHGNLSKKFDLIIEKYLPDEFDENNEFKVIHNLDESILDQLFDELDTYEFSEIDILAPFFSDTPKVLYELITNLKIKKINILLQDHNHNLHFPGKYQDLAKKNDVILEFKKAEFEDDKRIFHSKIIAFKGKTNFLLIGSPNFTISALLKDAKQGNIEFCILYRNLNSNNILSSINTEPIIHISDIKPELSNEIDVSNRIKIFSAEYNEIKRELQVIIDPIKNEAKVKVLLANEKYIDLLCDLNKQEFDIPIAYSYPKEIEIEIEGAKAKRRVFYDDKRIYRGGRYSYKDLDNKLYSDPIIDINDILAIFGGISHQKPKKNEKIDIKTLQKNKKKVLPSQILKKNALSIILDLNRINRFLTYKKRLLDEEDTLSESGLKTTLGAAYNLRDEQAEHLLIRIVELSNKILIGTEERLDDESEENWEIRSQSIFIDLLLPIIIKTIELEPAINKFVIFEKIKEILEEDIRFIEKDKCSNQVLSQFFTRITLLDYYFCDSFKEQETYNFLSTMFNYNDLINEKNFSETQEHIKKVINYLNLSFTNEIFIENFLDLMEYVFNSSTIEPGLKYVIKQANKENNIYQSTILKLIDKMIGYTEKGRFSFDEEGELYNDAIAILKIIYN